MKKSLTVNYLYNVAYKVLTLITPLITTPYVSRILGVDNIGIYNYTYSVLNYFILFGVLGFQMYGQREIAYQYNNEENRKKLFWEIVLIRLSSIGISTCIYYFSLWQTDYRLVYVIFSIELIANAIDISWYYYGIEEFKLITIRNFIVKGIGVACIFLFVKSKDDLLVYIFCNVIVLFLGNLSLWLGIKKNVGRPSCDCTRIFGHLKVAFIFFLPQCLDSIYMLMDKVMLGNLSTMQQVGIYGQADKIIKMIITIITSIGLVISPKIAQCYASKDFINLKKYMKDAFAFVFSLGLPMTFGLIAIAPSFSDWFFGAGYEGVSKIISMLAFIIIFMGLNSVMGWQYLMTVGREKDFTKSVAIGASVNLAINALLIPAMGAAGAVISSLVSMMIMTVINTYLIRDIISFNEIILMIPRPIFSSILMCLFVILIGKYMSCGMFSTMIQGIVGVMTYCTLMWLLKDPFMKPYLDKVMRQNSHKYFF